MPAADCTHHAPFKTLRLHGLSTKSLRLHGLSTKSLLSREAAARQALLRAGEADRGAGCWSRHDRTEGRVVGDLAGRTACHKLRRTSDRALRWVLGHTCRTDALQTLSRLGADERALHNVTGQTGWADSFQNTVRRLGATNRALQRMQGHAGRTSKVMRLTRAKARRAYN